ncbi:tumor necrosis factor receptor superfamily member 23-like [Megalobrama amblycephala]|uniref:tumor necrosis factor receptor superfamily member 23-like n=1 Tax=Megalobrama amblycephala TaxID=75352 RepID=UPI0020146C55|nr:tumor necrosis factor receptor superfamily member 23-like [Megalobrama amblycephala]
MNQTDSKRVLAIFVGALSTLCVETCPENFFQLPDSLCCPNCPEGMFVAKNCSNTPVDHSGVRCNKCRRCEDIGQITVSNCTLFSDTQCDIGPSVPTHQPQFDEQLSQLTLYGCSSVVVAVFILAVIMAVCCIRIKKSGESDESSEGEPFHVKDAETV